MSTRELILASRADRKIAAVSVPEWACGTVHVRTLSALERLKLDQSAKAQPGIPYVAVLCTFLICDEAGARVLEDADAPALADRGGHVLDRIVQAASKLFDVVDAGGLEKNS